MYVNIPYMNFMGSEIQHAVMDFQHAVTVISMCCWSLELPPTKGNQPFSKWWTPPEIGRTYLKDAPQVAQSEANKLQNTKTQVENAVEQRKKCLEIERPPPKPQRKQLKVTVFPIS